MDDQFRRLSYIPLRPTMVVWSGNRSIQAYWNLERPVTDGTFRRLMDRLCDRVHGNRNVLRPMQQMRLPTRGRSLEPAIQGNRPSDRTRTVHETRCQPQQATMIPDAKSPRVRIPAGGVAVYGVAIDIDECLSEYVVGCSDTAPPTAAPVKRAPITRR